MGMIAGGTGWLVLALLLMLPGVVLLWMSWRGRRVNDRIVCGKCGFDINGMAMRASMDVDGTVAEALCPECGRGVWRVGSARVGERQRGWWSVWVGFAGMLIVLIATGVGAVTAVPALKRVNWYAKMPGWMLQEFAGGRLGPGTEDVMAEVVKRLPTTNANGQVLPSEWTDAQLAALAGRAAGAARAAASPEMTKAWLDVYVAAMGVKGATTLEAESEVGDAVMANELKMRSLARSDGVAFVEFAPLMRASWSRSPIPVIWRPGSVRVYLTGADRREHGPFQAKFLGRTFVPGMMRGDFSTDPGDTLGVEPGEYQVRIEAQYQVGMTRAPMVTDRSPQAIDALFAGLKLRSIQDTGKVTVVARDKSAFELLTQDSASGRQVRASIVRWLPKAASGMDEHRRSQTARLADYEYVMAMEAPSWMEYRYSRVQARILDAKGRGYSDEWKAERKGWVQSSGVCWLMVKLTPPKALDEREVALMFGQEAACYLDVSIEPDWERLERTTTTAVAAERTRIRRVPVFQCSEPVVEVRQGMIDREPFVKGATRGDERLEVLGHDEMRPPHMRNSEGNR